MILRLYYLAGETAKSLESALKTKYELLEVKGTKIAGAKYQVFKFLVGSRLPDLVLDVNQPSAVEVARTKGDQAKILRLNLIPTVQDCKDVTGILWEYKVTLLDLAPLTVLKKNPGLHNKSHPWVPLIIDRAGESREVKRVLATARAALQCTGLDFGMVHLGVARSGKPFVIGLNDSPCLSPDEVALLASRLRDYQELAEPRIVTLGADPEFMIVQAENSQLVAASRFLPRSGTVGCDNVRIPNRQQRPVAEIRPQPAWCPLELVENVRQALIEATHMIPYKDLKWLAGSQPVAGYPTGGHIHFGNLLVSSKVLRALDSYLAIPVMLMENADASKKRRTRYGLLSDFRLKEHHQGFEYRTPSSWLVSPEAATGILCLARLIADNYLLLSRNYLAGVEAQEAFYSGDKAYFHRILPLIWQDISLLPQAKAYRQHLRKLDEMCRSSKGWEEERDIRVTWNIPIPSKVYGSRDYRRDKQRYHRNAYGTSSHAVVIN